MNIDIEALKQSISAIGMVISTLKQAKDLLPEGKQKKQVAEGIEQAERQLKIAEAQAAQSMGYKLCRNHFPPEIMLSSDNKNWKCPGCGNEIKYSQQNQGGNPMNRVFGNKK